MNFDDLNPQQKAAVEFSGKHVLVLAGAGTGKTKTIVSRAAYLISHGVNPTKIQILSFTRKSAKEIVNRVNSMLPNNKANLLSGSTFHAWCTHLIKSHPKIFPFHQFTLLAPEDQCDVFKLIMGKNKIAIKETRLKSSDFRDVYSYMVNVQCTLSNAIRHIIFHNQNNDDTNQLIAEIKQHFETIIRAYIQYKLNHRQLDYDDLLKGVVDILRQAPSSQKHIASKYEHILVDEMQDTNPLQWALLSLFQPYCHLFCVGDDAQSIYGFRGADFKNIHSFKEKVPESEVLKLEENYRSTQEILDVSNWLLDQSTLNYNKKLQAARGKGEIPWLVHFENNWEEANWIGENIIQNITERGKTYKDHLILARTNRMLTKIEKTCLEKRIPYQMFGGIKLLESAHIKDALSILKIIANIHDEIAWMRYLQLWQGIGETKANQYIEKMAGCKSITECIGTLKNISKITDITSVIEAIKDLNTNPSKAIEETIKNMDKILAGHYDDWTIRKSDFQVLIKMAEPYPSIDDFVTAYTLDPSLQEGKIQEGFQNDDVVTLSTIHSAKGLEADTCYVINVSPGIYPSIKSITQGYDEIEEERRCLYVALTRAKNKLIVTKSLEANRSNWNTPDTNKQINENYFFNHIPSKFFQDTVLQENTPIETDNHRGESQWAPWENFNFE